MESINRLLVLSAAVVGFVVASAGTVSAQSKEVRGSISAMTDTTLTLKAEAQEMTFFIDGDTRLEVRRSARDLQKAQPGNPRPRVNDFFEIGQAVRVRYEEAGGRNHALDVERVGSAGSEKKSSIVEGKVTAVSASQMSIAGDKGTLTFAVTGDTDVVARGATTATKAAGKGTPLTTFVHSGDVVSVTYNEADGKMTASQILVRIVNPK